MNPDRHNNITSLDDAYLQEYIYLTRRVATWCQSRAEMTKADPLDIAQLFGCDVATQIDLQNERFKQKSEDIPGGAI